MPIQTSLNQLDDSLCLATPLHFHSFWSREMLNAADIVSHIFPSVVFGLNPPFQLRVFHSVQDFSEKWAWLVSHLKQVIACQQTRRPNLLRRRLRQDAADEPIRPQASVARHAIEPVQLQMFLELRQPDK